MCKPPIAAPSSSLSRQDSKGRHGSFRLLYSLDSFASDQHGRPPLRSSFGLTVATVIAGFCACEYFWRIGLDALQHLNPVLVPELHRQIIARHVGVDALACGICSLLGWNAMLPMSTHPSGAEQRLLTYHPSAFRISLVFFAYQVKNLYDSYVWNDGPEFLFHHAFSLVTAWGSMYPGCGHYYVMFFMGVSEISTAILCLLANFDEKHGVPGLDAAFPTVKLVLGGAFVIMFIVCRCILWPFYSYHFGRDVLRTLQDKSEKNTRVAVRKMWMKFFLVSLTGLSILQIAWLGQIFVVADVELRKMGLLAE